MLSNKEKAKLCIIIVCFIGLLTTAIGIGTNAWFTASVAGNGTIQVGTFRLSLNADSSADLNTAVFNVGNIQPGIATDEKTISFVNTGSLDMILKGDLHLSAEDEAFNNGIGDTSAYKVIAEVYKNDDTASGNLIYSTANTESGEDISSFNRKINNMLDPQSEAPIVFSPDEKIICKLKILLDPYLAVNTHQGDTVTATLEVNARQNIAESSYEQ